MGGGKHPVVGFLNQISVGSWDYACKCLSSVHDARKTFNYNFIFWRSIVDSYYVPKFKNVRIDLRSIYVISTNINLHVIYKFLKWGIKCNCWQWYYNFKINFNKFSANFMS